MKKMAAGRTATTAATSVLIISTSLLPSLHNVASAQGFAHLPQHHHLQQQLQQPFGTAPNNPISTTSPSNRARTAEKAQAHTAAAGAEEAEADAAAFDEAGGSTIAMNARNVGQRKHHHHHNCDSANISVSIRCHCGAVDVPRVPLLLHWKSQNDDGKVGHDTKCTSCSSANNDNLLACYCERCRKSAIAAFGAYVRVAPSSASASRPAFFAQLQQENSHVISEHDDACSHLGPVTRYRCGDCHSSLGLHQHNRSANNGCGVNDATTGAGNSEAATNASSAGGDTGAAWLAMGAVTDESISEPIIEAWHSSWNDDDNVNSVDDTERQHLIAVACRNEKAAWVDARPNQSVNVMMATRIQPSVTVQQQRRLCIEGGCSCGLVRYEIDSIAPHPEFQHCHCNLCRRLSGSAYMTWVPVDAQEFRWIRTDGLILMRTTPHGQRHACKKCGSVLTIVYDGQPHLIWPAAGGFDDGDDLGSTEEVNERTGRVSHICCEWKAPWYRLPIDSLPRIQYAA